jgi:hypothetical protein
MFKRTHLLLKTLRNIPQHIAQNMIMLCDMFDCLNGQYFETVYHVLQNI